MTHVDSVEVSLSHGRTRVFTAGEGEPLLLLHGVLFHAAAESWLPVLPGLAAWRRVIAPDFVGWGPGDQLTQGYSFAYLTDFVRELTDALDISACDIVGHSMGGWTAALLAYESPARVKRLVLEAPGGLAVRPLASMQQWQPPTSEDIERHYAPYAAAGVDPAPLVAAALGRVADADRVSRFRSVMDHMTNHETRARYALGRRLSRISAETLLVWGGADPINPPQLADDAIRALPRSRAVLLDGAGHFAHIDNPREFVKAIRSFLDPTGTVTSSPASGPAGPLSAP